MTHKQETVPAANYEGLDRAEGALSETTGHEVRFWRDAGGEVWEEILGEPETGRRRLAPDYAEFHVQQEALDEGETSIDRKNRLRQEFMDEIIHRCGRFPFHLFDSLIPSYHQLVDTFGQAVGAKNLFLPVVEDEVVPKAFRVQNLVLNLKGHESEDDVKELLRSIQRDHSIYSRVIVVKPSAEEGVWVRGEFIPDNPSTEEKSTDIAQVKLNSEVVSEILGILGLNEDLERLNGKCELCEYEIVPFHDITDTERDVVNEISQRRADNKVRVPREGGQDEWVWAYRWKSSGVAGWVRVGAPDSEFQFEGTQRPDDVINEFAHMFDTFNIHGNLLGMLEDAGVDLVGELGVDEKVVEGAREGWKKDHSRSRRPQRRR